MRDLTIAVSIAVWICSFGDLYRKSSQLAKFIVIIPGLIFKNSTTTNYVLDVDICEVECRSSIQLRTHLIENGLGGLRKSIHTH